MSATWRIAWEYHTGDFSDGSDGRPETTFQATSILVDGVLYLATVYGRVIALSPERGAEIWKYDPGVDPAVERGEFANRGVTYWQAVDGVEGQVCERRILWPPWMLGLLRWTRRVEHRALILGRPVKWICRAESISANTG